MSDNQQQGCHGIYSECGKAGANDTYINAHSFCDLLGCIARLNIGVLITLVLDNARYQTWILSSVSGNLLRNKKKALPKE